MTALLPVTASRRRLAAQACFVGGSLVAIAGAVTVYLIDPSHANLPPLCMFHNATGLYCPGCGSTRALHHLLHGELLTAFRYNPYFVLVLPYLLLSYIRMGREIFGHPGPRRYAPAVFIWALLVCIILFWILRNIPVYPLTLLAPPA